MSQLVSLWKLPKNTTFADTPHGDFVEHFGKPDKALNLALIETQRSLLNSFIRIKDIESAREWIKQYGCPWARLEKTFLAFYGSDDLIGLAKSLRWVRNFYQLVKYQEVPFIRKHLRVKANPDFPKHGSITFTGLPDYDTEIVYVADPLRSNHPHPTPAFVSFVEIETDMLNKLDDEDFLVWMANLYLKKTLEVLLTDFTPVINIRRKPGPIYSLEQSFPTSTPWEAMVSILLKDITTSASPKVCSNPKCDNKFVPKRTDQVFCSKASCRKAESRRKKKTNS